MCIGLNFGEGGVLGSGMLALAIAILIVPAFINPEALQASNDSDLALKLLMHVAYSIQYWKKSGQAAGAGLLVCWTVGLILAAFYIQYYVLFRKNYNSFDRYFFKPQVENFWSWGFWKPSILTMLLGGMIGFAVDFVLGRFGVMDRVILLISFLVGLVLFHIFLQGRSWGFVPTRRQQNASEQLTANQ